MNYFFITNHSQQNKTRMSSLNFSVLLLVTASITVTDAWYCDTYCPEPVKKFQALPGGQRLPQRIMSSIAVPLRLQVPGEDDGGDHLPAALLLPEAEQHHPDHLPDRVQVRLARHVRADRMRGGHVCCSIGSKCDLPGMCELTAC